MKLWSAAIGARHKITRRYAIKAGSIEADTLKQAQDAALQAAYHKYPPSIYEDQQANVQDVPEEMLERNRRQYSDLTA
jgi:hypothetical protein